jgi:prefoldin alpha subunit
MLVPITSSLYVPGETAPLDTVLIDVGTGYYIEKSGPEAQAFLDRKIHLITGQAYKVAQALQIKQEGMQGCVQAMNSKITQYQQQQKQVAS